MDRSPRQEETENKTPKPDNKGAPTEQGEKKSQPKARKAPKSVKCFRCGEPGHKQADCQLKVNRIEVISPRQLNDSLRPGKILDKSFNILLDSGAEVSLVRKSVLPKNWKQMGEVAFMTASGHILKRPGTTVEVHMGTRSFNIECGVVENSIISVPLLIGNNIPELKLLHLMMEMAPAQTSNLTGRICSRG